MSARVLPRGAKAQWKRLLALWTHPVGTRVVVRLDDDTLRETTTRSLPWALGHGEPVILLVGISGGYALERVRALETAAASPSRCPTCHGRGTTEAQPGGQGDWSSELCPRCGGSGAAS